MKVQPQYFNYLRSGCKIELLPEVINSLMLAGLTWEANLLNLFFQNNGEQVNVMSDRADLLGVPVVISLQPPAYTSSQLIWFDPVELMPYYYSCPSPDSPTA